MTHEVTQAQWSLLGELVAETTGLHFPGERRADLRRGAVGAAHELGFADAAAFVGWLLSGPPSTARFQALVNHLTVGETYFFRDPQTLEAIERSILPELIGARHRRERRLRIWSAACCTGEEAYMLAIILHRLLPDLPQWDVAIMGTDINARFLQKAAAGAYGEWSFRGAPAWLRQRYFSRSADGRYVIVPEVRKLVTFAHHNLVEDAYPCARTDTHAMDLVVCRNALMYLAPPQMRKAIARLRDALVDGGWLAVGPSEASKALFPGFANVNFPGAILFRRGDASADQIPAAMQTPAAWVPPPPAPQAAALAARGPASFAEPEDDRLAEAHSLYAAGRYAEAAEAAGAFLTASAGRVPASEAYSLLIRALANQRRLDEAQAWCERWVAAAKLQPAAHYLHAVVLLERGDAAQARASLQRTLYLEPGFVLAHLALANLARASGIADQAERHFDNALRLLRMQRPDAVLPESDGLTAGRLAEFIASSARPGGAP